MMAKVVKFYPTKFALVIKVIPRERFPRGNGDKFTCSVEKRNPRTSDTIFIT